MKFKEKIEPDELEQLPIAEFKGEIVLVEERDSKFFDAIEYLKNQKILGFDTETKPTFTANIPRPLVSILQLSGRDRAFIFRLQALGLEKELISVLSSRKIIKVGAAVKDDIKALQKLAKFSARGFVDLQIIAENWGIEVKSVRKMAAIILGTRVSKSQQLSNWESLELTQAQLNYAAIDAWICQKMYLKLLSTPKLKRDKTLVVE